MSKQNCWEFKQCGQGQNCPAYMEEKLDGIHEGVNGGRSCWVIAGTLCGGIIQGSFAKKVGSCMQCDFYKSVKQEEFPNFKMSASLIKLLS